MNKKIDDEEGPLLFTLVETHFENIKKLKTIPNISLKSKRPSIVPIVKRNSIIKELLIRNKQIDPKCVSPKLLKAEEESNYSSGARARAGSKFVNRRESRKLSLQQSLNIPSNVLSNLKKTDQYMKALYVAEADPLKVCPKVENRIICIKDNKV